MMRKLLSALPKKVIGYASGYLYRPKATYSGEGEDSVTSKLFARKDNGLYVDIGCFHPRVASNTHLLYKKGWKGVNVDPDPYKIAVFDHFRKRDKNLCLAISDKEGTADFYYQDGESYGSMSGLVKSEAERRASALGRKLMKRSVPTKPLSSVLESEGIKHIDFLTIDVEGAEDLVLSTLDFDAVRVDVIAVEIHGDFSEVTNSSVHLKLTRNGYEIVAWTPPTVFYRRPSAQ